ncbi:MAG TPA: hypothetical protein VHB74_05485 [Devosia sp.]|nr:hypothetical protein [Devosia sp.]
MSFNPRNRLALAALLLLAGPPQLATGPALAAARPAATHKQPQSKADLERIADRAEAQAAAARKQADKLARAAASAEANLRTAESNLSAIRAAGGTSTPTISVPTPSMPNAAVESAQQQLQAAQAAEQQANIQASASMFNTAPNATGAPAIFNNMAQTNAQNAHQAVITAQQNLEAAQRAAAAAPPAPAPTAGLTGNTLLEAERSVATARSLAASARKAADAAERNAQTLAEDADRARKAADAAK